MPIEAYNNEVLSPADRLPHFFPLTDDIATFTFNLPLGDAPWADALKQLVKDLNFPHKTTNAGRIPPSFPASWL
jgi:hypothetical protein